MNPVSAPARRLLVTLSIFLPQTAAFAQAPLPLDTRAVFRTHVAHWNSQTSAGGGGGGSTAAAPAAAFGGAPYTVGPTVTCTSTVPEAEEHIAVDPNQANTLVAAISDFALRGGYNTTKYALSTDGGTAWSEAYVPLSSGFPVTGDGRVWEANSDPVLAIDRLGNVYLADLYLNASNNANGLYVSVANLSSGTLGFLAGGTSAVATNPDPSTTVSEDKEWIAADTSSSSFAGTVYVSWTRFVGSSDTILLSRSTDQGVSWSLPVQINPSWQNGGVQGSQVAVGPAGDVYVAYEVFFVGGKRQHYLAKSTDGGASFSAAVAASPQFNELSFNSTYRKNSFPALAVNPLSGFVYLVYADQPNPSAGAQVEFIRSTAPGAASFTTPTVIHDKSTGQQFFPALAADENGVIHASWFDTRNNGKKTSLYDIYATRSLDNGATFSPNARVTASSINAGSTSFIGDYMGEAAGGGSAHPVWTKGGFNGGRLQTATLR